MHVGNARSFRTVVLASTALLALPALAQSGREATSALRLAQRGQGVTAPGVARIEVDRDVYSRLRDRGRGLVREFPLPDRQPVDLELEAFDVVAPGARFAVVDANGEREVDRPDLRLFRGRVAGDPDGLAVLGLGSGRVSGFVRAFGEEFGIGPEAPNLARREALTHRVWNAENEDKPDGPVCAADDLAPPADLAEVGESSLVDPAVGAAGAAPGALLRVPIAIDATYDWFQRFGSVTSAQSYILNLMGQVSTIYENEIGVRIEVVYLRIHTAEPDPYTNGTTDTSLLLSELRSHWNQQMGHVERAAVHLFSVRPSGGSGIAYIDVLCHNDAYPGGSYDYGVSTLSANGGSWEKGLVAHELGHNFSSPHTHCYSPEIDRCYNQSGCYAGPVQQITGTIMSYCNSTTPTFHQRSRDEKLRPGAEAGFGICIDAVGDPGSIGSAGSLVVDKPAACSAAQLRWDDGVADSTWGYSGTTQMLAVKRFTPPCHPFRLERIEVQFLSSSVAVGRPLRLVVYADPAGAGTPLAATLVHAQDVTAQVVGPSTFNSFVLNEPVLAAAGDLYIGVYDLLADSTSTYLATIDTGHSGDSFRAPNTTDPQDLVAHTGGSFMIRGTGGAVPAGTVGLEWGPSCNASAVPGQDYAVYFGSIGEFDTKSTFTCSTAGMRNLLATDLPDDSFFLVVPTTPTSEGSYGRDGHGAERPPAAEACKPQSIGTCAP